MIVEQNTKMMTLLNHIDCGMIKTAEQFNKALGEIADSYGTETTAESYLSMLKHCSPQAQEKISRLANGGI